MSTQRLDMPLIRRLRDTAKEAGLAGKDPVSEHTQALVACTAALMARRPVGEPRRDWWVAAIVAGTMLFSVGVAGLAGYHWGRSTIFTDANTRCFVWEGR